MSVAWMPHVPHTRQGCRVWGTKGFCLLLTFQK